MRIQSKWLLVSAALFLLPNACSKKSADEPIAAVKGPVQAPKPVDVPGDVIAWLVAGDPQSFIQAAETLAAKAGPVPPGTLGMGINAALVDLGLKDTSVVNLGAPAGVLVLNPKKYPQALVVAVTTQGEQKVSEALKPAWTHKGQQDGIHQFSRETLDTYAVFQGGKDTAKTKEQSIFVRFAGPTALVGPDRDILKAGADLLLARLREGAPAQGASGQVRLDHLRTIFGMELAMMPEMIKQQLKTGMSQAQAVAGMPDPKAMEWMTGLFVDKAMAFFNQTKACGFALGVDADGGLMHFTVEPEKDSFFAQFLAGQKKAPLVLDRALPPDAFLAMAMNVQWAMVKDDLLAFSVDIFKNLMGLQESKELLELTREFFQVVGEEVAVIEDLGPNGELRVVELVSVTDTDRARAIMKKLMALTNTLFDDAKTGVMGIRMSYEGPKSLGKHKDIELEEFRVKMDMASLPEAQARMMKKMYGADGMGFVMAVFDNKLALAVGKTAAADVKAVIDRSMDKQGGLTVSPAFTSAAGGLEKGAGGYMYMSLTRLMSFSVNSTFAMTGSDAKLPKLPDSKSGMFMRFGTEEGRLVTTLRMPAAHLEDLGKMVQALSQLSGGPGQ